ncbi:hypothetical protein EDD22DRAFT_911442, partial [Suillus occidentalis]
MDGYMLHQPDYQCQTATIGQLHRHSVLTIVYLSDVPPSSKPGALARSAWNTQGRMSIINNTYRSDLCLLYPPHLLAITALYLAVVLHGPTRELLQQRSRSVEATPAHSSPRRSSRQSSSTSLSHGKKHSQDFVAFFAELNVPMPLVATIAQEIISLYILWERYLD